MDEKAVSEGFDALRRDLNRYRIELAKRVVDALSREDLTAESTLRADERELLDITRSLQSLHERWNRVIAPAAPEPSPQRVSQAIPQVQRHAPFAYRGTDKTLSDLAKARLIELPMEIYKDYRGQQVTATIQRDCTIHWRGQEFTSLSYAAIAVVQALNPTREKPQENGWRFWQFFDSETRRYSSMDTLRSRLVGR